jgi:hypothetical protein
MSAFGTKRTSPLRLYVFVLAGLAQITTAIKPPAAAQTSTAPNTAPATAAPAPSKP